MMSSDFKCLLEAQRHFYRSGVTRDYAYRRRALERLREALVVRESRLAEALRADLGKGADEAYMTEIGMLRSSVSDALRHLRAWMRPRRVPSSLANFPSSCRVLAEPYGLSLVISPWNYPLLLSLDPLVAALAAGNCCVIKCSEYAPESSRAISELISELYPREYVTVVEGGAEVSQALLRERFDCIFFTGGGRVGQLVMEAAARHLTPVTLELGGKSPCIIDRGADLELAARRIAFGKILNAGQTCVAPDYVLLPRGCEAAFTEAFRRAVRDMLGDEPCENEQYVHIVNERHFVRLCGLMQDVDVLAGGRAHAEFLRIEPTLLGGVTPDSRCMQEEIFGPLLPVIPCDGIAEAEEFVLARPKPLACYIFTESRRVEQRLLERLSFGGCCVNDTIVHLAVPGLPFGGVGASGMGAYHGKAGFDAFTHYKSVLRRGCWLDLPFRYHPFSALGRRMLRLFLR